MSSYSTNIILTLTRQLIGLFIGLATLAIITRTLGPEHQGEYTLLILIPLTLFNFLNFGLGSSAIYWIGKKEFKLADIFITNKRVGILLSILAFFLAIIFHLFWGDKFLEGISTTEFTLIICSIPFLFLINFYNSIFQGNEDFKSYNSILLTNQLLLAATVIVTIVLFELKLIGAVISFTASQILTLLLTYYYFKKNKYTLSNGKFSSLYFNKSYKYGLKLFASNALAFINYRADLFLISYFLDFKSVGIYAISVLLMERLWIIPGTVSSVLYARIANLTNHTDRNNTTSISTRIILPLMVMATGILVICADPLIPWIFGNEYIESIDPLLYLVPGILFGAISKTISNDFSGRGQAHINIYVSVFTVIINIVGNIILIPKLGIAGAAISTSISYSFNAIVKSIIFCYLYNENVFNLLIIKKKDMLLLSTITKKYLHKK